MVNKKKINKTKKKNNNTKYKNDITKKNKYGGGKKIRTLIEKIKKIPDKNIFLRSMFNVIIYGDMFVPYSPIEKLGYLTALTKSVVRSHKTGTYKIIEWDELNKYKESINTINLKQKLYETNKNSNEKNKETNDLLMFLHNIKLIIPYTNKTDITITINYNDFVKYLRELFDNDVTQIMYNINTDNLNYNEKFLFMIIFMIKQIKIELKKLKNNIPINNSANISTKMGGSITKKKKINRFMYSDAGPTRRSQPEQESLSKTQPTITQPQKLNNAKQTETFKVEDSKIICEGEDEKMSEFLEKYLKYLIDIENVDYCPNIKTLLLEIEKITDIDNVKNIYIKIISIWKKKMYYNIMSNFSSFNQLNSNIRSLTFPLLYFSKEELKKEENTEENTITSSNNNNYNFFGFDESNNPETDSPTKSMTGGFGFTYQSLGIGKYMKDIDSVIESKYLLRHSDLGINKYNQSHIDSLLSHVIDDISTVVKADKKEKKKSLKKSLRKSVKHSLLKRAFSSDNIPVNTTETISYIKSEKVKKTLKECFNKIDENLSNEYKTKYLHTVEDVPEIKEVDIDDINDKFKMYCKLEFAKSEELFGFSDSNKVRATDEVIIEKADTNFINCIFSIINKILEISIKKLNIPLYKQYMDVDPNTNKTLLNYNKLLNGTLKKSKMKSNYVKYLSFINLILELFITDNFQIIQLFLDEFYELIFNTSDINGIILQYSEFIKKNKEKFEKLQSEQTKQVAMEIKSLQSESLIPS